MAYAPYADLLAQDTHISQVSKVLLMVGRSGNLLMKLAGQRPGDLPLTERGPLRES